jgi:hypothetical protein
MKLGEAILSESEHGGITIQFNNSNEYSISASPLWSMAGWQMSFVQLAANTKLQLDHSKGKNYVKVITGQLSNINRDAFAQPKTVRNTIVDADYVQTGSKVAIIAIMIKTPQTPESINSMEQMSVRGPKAELLSWKRCDEYEWGKEIFKNVEFYNLRGFQIKNAQGKEVCYVQFWTAGKGVKGTDHNHSKSPSESIPAFCEIHFGMFNGTGQGGMVDSEVTLPILEGDEHGPFWKINSTTGEPVLRDNGAVYYDIHRWQAGQDKKQSQAFDVWAAFEISPSEAIFNHRGKDNERE